MQDASQRRFDAVLVWKLDRFGRSVKNCVDGIGQLSAHGVRFIAVSQSIDTDESNPTSRLLLHILASVAEFERELIRERMLAGLANARQKGVRVGRPKRVFRRDEVVRLWENERMSWRAIAALMSVPASTVRDAYQCARAKLGRKPAAAKAKNTAVQSVA